MYTRVDLDEETLARLNRYAAQSGRSVSDLIECAVSEAALNATRHWDFKKWRLGDGN